MYNRPVLISCGILRKEIMLLIDKNNWNLDPVFLNSSLHVDFHKLMKKLGFQLEKYHDRAKIVCYGTCHPQIDERIGEMNGIRTPVQNCVELILGKNLFTQKLEEGAFFLFEDWAVNWDTVVTPIFGDDPLLQREIFQSEHKFLFAIRTECSKNFKDKAESISAIIDLPIVWYDAGLDILEDCLKTVLGKND